MKLKIPRADALAIGTTLTALIALAQETHWDHWVKQVVIIVGGLLLAIVVNPITEGAPAGEQLPAPGANVRPDVVPPGPTDDTGQPL